MLYSCSVRVTLHCLSKFKQKHVLKFSKDINKLDHSNVNCGIWSIFVNDGMWDVLCLSEEGEIFKRFLVNHQIHKKQTITETVQASLQYLTNVAAEFHGT